MNNITVDELKCCYTLALDFKNKYLTEEEMAAYMNTNVLHVKLILREGRKVRSCVDYIHYLMQDIKKPATKTYMYRGLFCDLLNQNYDSEVCHAALCVFFNLDNKPE